MWLSHHNAWHRIQKVNNSTVVYTLLMLFFASFFPYTTSIVAQNSNNVTAQALYGIIILLVSLSNIGISHSLNVANHGKCFQTLYDLNTWAVVLDLSIKVLGLILTLTVFPPAVLYSVLINVILLTVSEAFSRD